MATLTTSGMSGLNVNSLVAQLVAAERAPQDARIARAERKLTTEITAMGQLKGALSAFQIALGGLKDPGDFDARKTVVGDEKLFTATATSAAGAGRYDVEVRQLARAAQLGSAAIAGGAAAVLGAGMVTIAQGATSFDVTLAPGSTLADLRDGINSATGNPGVQATLITDVTGTHLVLSGGATGASNALSVTISGGNPALNAFVHTPPGASAMTVMSSAQDAIAVVSGYEIRDSDNVLEGAVEGVTLNLVKAALGTTASLDVSVDQQAIRGRVDDFIKAYNNLAAQMQKLRAYDSKSGAAGPLLGDAMLRNIESQVRRMISDPVAGGATGYTTLASIGITTSASGTLALDEVRFNSAVAADRTVLTRMFSSSDGVAARLDGYIKDRLAVGGEVAVRDTRMQARSTDITKQKQSLAARMQIVETRLMKQFSSLDSMLTKMQSTSSYLSQQLSSMKAL